MWTDAKQRVSRTRVVGTATGYQDAGSDDLLFGTLIRSALFSARSDDQIGMDDRTEGTRALSKRSENPEGVAS